VKSLKFGAVIVSLLSVSLFSGNNIRASVVSKEKIYTNTTVTQDILYRLATNYLGTTDSLKLDIYAPTGAPDTSRPCVVLIHGGSFITGTKSDTLMSTFCSELALRGYIAVSLDYRLGVNITDITGILKNFNQAVYRATQDSKAALRFLRANASQYHIDTSNIFCGGYSAGAVTTVHHAYMSQSEAVTIIDTTGLGLLENGENLDQSSSFKAAINYCGAIGDTNWLQANDIPIISFHGTADTVVPYTMGYAFKLPLFPFIFGSGTINRLHQQLGVKDSLYTAPDEGHSLSLTTIVMSILKVSDFLYGLVDPSNTSIRNARPAIVNGHLLTQSAKTSSLFGLDGRLHSSRATHIVPGAYVRNNVKSSRDRKQLIVKTK
jgi:acetyl esterase/lipase